MVRDRHPARPRRFELASRLEDNTLEVALAGALDMAATLRMEPELDRLIDERPVRRLVFDLAEISFVDSAGLGLLLSIHERTKARGIEMSFARPSEPMRRILDVSGGVAVLRET